jgi:hypothetical protein
MSKRLTRHGSTALSESHEKASDLPVFAPCLLLFAYRHFLAFCSRRLTLVGIRSPDIIADPTAKESFQNSCWMDSSVAKLDGCIPESRSTLKQGHSSETGPR